MKTEKHRSLSSLRHDNLWGYLFVSPSMIGFVLFVLGPLVMVFLYSMQSRNLLTGHVNFIGFRNFMTMFTGDPLFRKTMVNSLVFMGGLVPMNVVLALSLSILLSKKSGVNGFFQTCFFLPVVTSAVAWAIVWRLMLQGERGVVNQALGLFGIKGPNWLYHETAAMASVIFTRVIKGVGLNMIIYQSALANIPEEFRDAARIDGAGAWHVFRFITLPLLAPTTIMIIIITIMGSLKVFDTIVLMTGGGPSNSTTVLVYYIYYQAFKTFETGYASALSVVLFLITLTITGLQWAMRRRLAFAETA